MALRLSIVLGVASLALAGWFALGSVSSPNGYSCGSWVSPAYSSSGRATAQRAITSGHRQLAADGEDALRGIDGCDAARRHRAMLTLFAVAGAVAIPTVVLFVAGASPRRRTIPA